MPEDDLDFDSLDEEDVADPTPEAKAQAKAALGAAGQMKALKDATTRIKDLEKEVRDARAEAAAAGYLKALKDKQFEEEAFEKAKQIRNAVAAADAFRERGETLPPDTPLMTAREIYIAKREGRITDEEAAAIIRAGRMVREEQIKPRVSSPFRG